MAAGSFQFYDQTPKTLGGGDVDSATIKAALVSSSYTPNQTTHTTWADASTYEITGGGTTGYTAGGQTLSSVAWGSVTKGQKLSSSNLQWTAGSSTIGTWKYCVFYISGSWNGQTNPLIGYFEGESGSTVPATTDTNTLTISCPAGGWFDNTRP